jgi:hypothetical protein
MGRIVVVTVIYGVPEGPFGRREPALAPDPATTSQTEDQITIGT